METRLQILEDTGLKNFPLYCPKRKQESLIDMRLSFDMLNAFVDKIVVHERVKQDGKRTQAIDIYYSYVGIVDIPTDEEMRETEQEYMRNTNLQTA